jgi:hypothetical protein
MPMLDSQCQIIRAINWLNRPRSPVLQVRLGSAALVLCLNPPLSHVVAHLAEFLADYAEKTGPAGLIVCG